MTLKFLRWSLTTIALAMLVVLLYLPGLSGPWLFDDHSNLLENSALAFDPTVADEWRTAALSSDSGPLRRPLAMLTFAGNVALAGGLSPLPVKATNLAIHLLCGLLVFGLALSILRTLNSTAPYVSWHHQIALLAAAIWLLQPLHVSTVLYAVQRMAQLAALGILAGLWVFVHLRQRWAARGASPAEVVAGGLWLALLTGLASLGKENGMLLPWLLLALEVSLFRGRWAGRDLPWLEGVGWVLLVVPLTLGVVAWWWIPEFFLQGYAGRDFTVEERLLTQTRLLWQYLYWLLVPAVGEMGLHHDDVLRSTSLVSPWTTAAAVAGWLLLLAAAVSLRRRFPLLLLAVLLYLIGHAMESSIWPLEMVFEHRNYLPSVGVMVLLAWTLVNLSARLGRLPMVTVPLALCLVLSGFLFIRTSTWAEDLRLAQVNSVNHPDSIRARHAVANILLERFLSLEESGLDRDVRAAYFLESRRLYAENARRDPNDLGSLVMLYQLDSSYFGEGASTQQWLVQIHQATTARPLQVSDHIALRTLLRCLGDARCRAGEGTSAALVELLQNRYPDSQRIADLEYQYLQSSKAAVDERLAMLDSALAIHPGAIGLRYRLMEEAAAAGDYAAVYEQVRAVMANDPGYRQLTRLRRLFPKVAVATDD